MSGLSQIYRLELDEKDKETGQQTVHTIVEIPDYLQRVDTIDNILTGSKKEEMAKKEAEEGIGWTYNIVMVDVSSSMRQGWQSFVLFWNRFIKDKLDGEWNQENKKHHLI